MFELGGKMGFEFPFELLSHSKINEGVLTQCIIGRLDSIIGFLYRCTQSKNLRAIKILHANLLRTGLLFISPNLQPKLVFSYTSIHGKDSHKFTSFFKCVNPINPLTFNLVVSNFCRNGFPVFALKTLSFMHRNDVGIDTYALCSSLTASCSIKDVEFGKQVHCYIEKLGWLSSVFVGSALIDLYAKSYLVEHATKLFDEMPGRNVVCANALLSGYCEANMWYEGMKLIWKMPILKLDYDHFTLSAMLRVSAGLSAIELGRQVHAYLFRISYDLENDVFLQSSLIEMYGKCGLVEKALHIFSLAGFRRKGEKMRDVVLWTSMLGAYGRNGYFKEVINLYEEMLKEGIKPDGVSFVTVVSACGHTGHVDLGIEYFESMTRNFNLIPGPEHYSCLVDMLCRSGDLDKAWKLVSEMPHQGPGSSSVPMWGALLSACNDRGNVQMGELAAQNAIELDPQNDGIYVILSNLYAKFGMWDEIGKLRKVMNERGLQKDVGCSWLEVTR